MKQCDTFRGKFWSIVIDARCPVVPLVCGFIRRDNLLSWLELFTNVYELKSRIWFWEEYIHFERIYREGMRIFVKFRQNIPGIMRNQSVSGNLDIQHIFPVASIYATRLPYFFSYSNFRCGHLYNRPEYRKSPTQFCWLMPCEQDCAAILLEWRHPIADKFNWTLGRFTPYRLLTLPKRKKIA